MFRIHTMEIGINETWDLGQWSLRRCSYDEENKKFRMILQCGSLRENLEMPSLPLQIPTPV